MQRQRKAADTTKGGRRPARRPDYIAAVRYLDGRSDLVRVRDADNLAEARAMVLAELVDVRTVMIATNHRWFS